MTVAELKDILDDFDDNCEVYINYSDNPIRDVFGGFNEDDEEFMLIVT